jgi:hypothetical protein
VNCCVSPAGTDAVGGVTEIDVRVAEVTVKVADPLIDPEVAVMVAVPTATVVANPVCNLIVATATFDEVQLALVVKFCVVPLL